VSVSPPPFLESLPDVEIGRGIVLDGQQLVFILGPCVMESEAFVRDMADRIHGIADTLKLRWVFKASYDKANRSSGSSFRGPGVEQGCKILGKIADEHGVPVTTDVHSVEEIQIASQWIDFLQIPAFLCRQTDLILAAGQSGRAVNVKKGQFLAPWDVKNIADKLKSVGCKNFAFTERGTTFGYQNLVADMRSLYWMRETGCRVIMDATHAVQRPGGLGTATGGDGKLAPVLARSAVAAGCDGVFIETHINPAEAFSDGPNQIPLDELPDLLHRLQQIHQVVNA